MLDIYMNKKNKNINNVAKVNTLVTHSNKEGWIGQYEWKVIDPGDRSDSELEICIKTE